MVRWLLVVSSITISTTAARAQSTPRAGLGAPSETSVAMVDSPRALSWRAPAGCPDAASLRARVEQRMDHALDAVAIGVTVDVVLAAGRYVARVDLRAVTVANDVRTLTSPRCDELADAVAVIVARVASEQIARRRIAMPAEPEPVAETAVVIERAPPRVWTVGARLAFVNGIGLIPSVGLGSELAITLRRHSTMAELAGTRWGSSTAQFRTVKLGIGLDAVTARVGWRPYELPLRAWFAAEGGAMHRDDGIPQVDSGRWLAAGCGFGIAWQMRKWVRLVGSTETMVAIERARFALDDGRIAYAPAPMAFRTSFGLEVGWQ